MFFIWSKDKKIKGAQRNVGAHWKPLTWADAVKVSGLSTLTDLGADPCSFNSHRNAPMAVYAWLSNSCVQRPCYVFTSPLYCMLKQPLRQCHVSSSWKSRRYCCFQFPWSTAALRPGGSLELSTRSSNVVFGVCAAFVSLNSVSVIRIMCEYEQLNIMKSVFFMWKCHW